MLPVPILQLHQVGPRAGVPDHGAAAPQEHIFLHQRNQPEYLRPVRGDVLEPPAAPVPVSELQFLLRRRDEDDASLETSAAGRTAGHTLPSEEEQRYLLSVQL